MSKYLKFNILIGILFFSSCNNSTDYSVDKEQRQIVSDAQGYIHLFVDSSSSQSWINQLTKSYPLDSQLYFQNRYLSSHSFILHSRSNLDITHLANIRLGIIQNYNPKHFDKSLSLYLENKQLTAYKNPCATGQWLLDIGDLSVPNISKSDWKKLQLFIQELSDDLGLDGYFERNNPTEYLRGIQSEIESIWGISIQIPNDWKVFGTDTGFLWLGKLNPNGGFSSLWIHKTVQSKNRINLNEHFRVRNTATKKYFHNDEGTKMVISEIPVYKSTEIEENLFRGWYTEEATTRRGPYFTKYIFNSRDNCTLLVDVFCSESENMSSEVEFLKHLIKTVSFVP